MRINSIPTWLAAVVIMMILFLFTGEHRALDIAIGAVTFGLIVFLSPAPIEKVTIDDEVMQKLCRISDAMDGIQISGLRVVHDKDIVMDEVYSAVKQAVSLAHRVKAAASNS